MSIIDSVTNEIKNIVKQKDTAHFKAETEQRSYDALESKLKDIQAQLNKHTENKLNFEKTANELETKRLELETKLNQLRTEDEKKRQAANDNRAGGMSKAA